MRCRGRRHHVSDAGSAGRVLVKPHDFETTNSRNDLLESPIWSNTSVHVETAKPVLGASASSFSKVPVATHLVSQTLGSTGAAFQAAAPLLKPKETSSKEINLAVRNPLPTEENNDVLVISICRPQFSRSLPNITSPPPLEIQHEVPRREGEKLEFEIILTTLTVSYWHLNFRTAIYSGCCHPSDAMSSIREIELAQTFDDHKTSQSIAGNQFTSFEMLDAKVATSLKRILTNTNFKTKGVLGRAESPKSLPISPRTTNRLQDLRILSCYRC